MQRTRIADDRAKRVFLLLAERTSALGDPKDEDPPVMGLELHDADIPDLAARTGIDAAEFRRLLRVLKESIPMDVLEHTDGVWEIVVLRTVDELAQAIADAVAPYEPVPPPASVIKMRLTTSAPRSRYPGKTGGRGNPAAGVRAGPTAARLPSLLPP